MSNLKAIHIDELYINLVYQKQGYVDIVGMAAEQSMRASVDEVKSLQEYQTKGEVHVCVHIKLCYISY